MDSLCTISVIAQSSSEEGLANVVPQTHETYRDSTDQREFNEIGETVVKPS